MATWATEVVIAQKLAEAAWQPFNRSVRASDGLDVT
jgi:hypothetical protein